MPLRRELKGAVEAAKKEGDAIALHRRFLQLYEEGNMDERLYTDFGWLTYYALKQTAVNEVLARKKMLNLYLKLNLERPSILHSLILQEAVKVEKNTPKQFRIRDFIRLWGLENLRAEDWEQFRTDQGNTLPSQVEKLIGVYAKELKTDQVAAPEEFIELVDKALERYPQSQNMPYFKATILISQGKREEALGYYKDMILRFPTKFYLWSQAAGLVEDRDVRIGLLCKALSTGAEEQFLLNVRMRLATLLIEKGLKANARYELDKYRATCRSNGWNLKTEFLQVDYQARPIEAVESNKPLYDEYSVHADEFIYSALPTVVAVKVSESQNDDRFHPGRRITVWTFRTESDTIRLRRPEKFRLGRRVAEGTVFDIKLREGKIVWIRRHSGRVELPWLREGSGTVRLRTDRNGNPYAIIDHSYVGARLLRGIEDGQQLRILSVRGADGRWSAIATRRI